MDKGNVEEIANEVSKHFRCFGGAHVNKSNPISVALKATPAQFAAGVDVKDVVTFILSKVDFDAAGETPEEQWTDLEKYVKEQISKIDKKVAWGEREPAWWVRMMKIFRIFHNAESI